MMHVNPKGLCTRKRLWSGMSPGCVFHPQAGRRLSPVPTFCPLLAPGFPLVWGFQTLKPSALPPKQPAFRNTYDKHLCSSPPPGGPLSMGRLPVMGSVH